MDPPQKPADLDLNCSIFIKEDTSELSFEPVNYMLLKQDIIVSNKRNNAREKMHNLNFYKCKVNIFFNFISNKLD